ncbi:MmgE/PrpD family protein [Propionimicrobium sp. PCR01-08-3]|uniref:MmgE/PrpD family protein n=1 Tax=Propionimicrobium sp. PCR01-08-3 TaxID=3052086 RepID=UPI00255C6000|nr:MmgE/PrpD family protein [Propionimicrobium sp. PCR01-08-3]WIY83979.1 MmgE/PrpD family protein [Propionimicrobium sp. PCR01-08-3]
MTLVESLGSWLANPKPTGIPRPVIEKMRTHLLDTIGAIVIGDGRGPVLVAEQAFDAAGSVPVLVSGRPRDIRDAARVNAVAAHASEIDDTEGCDHTGAVVVPTLLALLSEPGALASGDDLLCAMTAGYELGRRLQNSLGGYDAHNGSGWHSTGTCGVFAAAAAAARALHLNESQCAAALSLAADSSGGTWAFAADGSMAKQLHVAEAAGSGLQAALLARAGASGPTKIFEPVWGGFFTTHGNDRCRPETLTEDLGVRWWANHSAIKMYASCRSTHASIDGIVEGVEQGLIHAGEVEHIRIEIAPFLAPMICPPNPASVEAARMSLPIALAFLLLGRPLDPDTFEDYHDPDVAQIAEQIEIMTSDAMSSEEVKVTVAGANSDYVIDRTEARGNEETPFGWDDVLTKFVRLVSPRIGAEATQLIVDWVQELGPGVIPEFPDVHAETGRDNLMAALREAWDEA